MILEDFLSLPFSRFVVEYVFLGVVDLQMLGAEEKCNSCNSQDYDYGIGVITMRIETRRDLIMNSWKHRWISGFDPQDGRARAMNAAMIDDEFNVDSRHLKRPKKPKAHDAIKDGAKDRDVAWWGCPMIVW